MSEASIWRGYGQAALDRQYNSRGTVADAGIYLREYADRTRGAKASLLCHENLCYGDGTDDRLDLYPAAANAATAAPVLVFIHGGDWRALSKNDSGFAAPAFTASGAVFVALDFTLVPASTLPAMGAQVRRALVWLSQNVAAYGGDPARIHIAGHSSGANLVGQCLMAQPAGVNGAGPELIKSALMISGLGDLEPVRLSFRNQQLNLTPEVVSRASLLHQQPGTHCPLLVAVGEKETEDYRRQSRELAEYWRSHGNAATLLELKGRHHFDAVLEWADPASGFFRASRVMLD
jgi:arylformamidase